jgi:hypothetical protein
MTNAPVQGRANYQVDSRAQARKTAITAQEGDFRLPHRGGVSPELCLLRGLAASVISLCFISRLSKQEHYEFVEPNH